MNFNPSQIAQTLTASIGHALFAADRNLLYRQGTGRYQELDGARSRGLPVLAGSGNRSVRHLPE
jgi:hypothetical protein